MLNSHLILTNPTSNLQVGRKPLSFRLLEEPSIAINFAPHKKEPDKTSAALTPVPPNLSLDDQRYYITCGNWHLAIQLTQNQAFCLIQKLLPINWMLNSAGIPVHLSEIWAIAELELEGGENHVLLR
jgi:hypothetical protein